MCSGAAMLPEGSFEGSFLSHFRFVINALTKKVGMTEEASLE